MNDTANSGDYTNVSAHYDADYFAWQRDIGAFGGWANAFKFRKSVTRDDTVVDFGCGGGFLLNSLACKRRIGIEPNPAAAASAEALGVQHFSSPVAALAQLGEGVADVIISNNALEHTLNPLQEIKNLRPLLKLNGIIHFVVPCDAISYRYNPADINYHLFSWSPQNLGNLFTEAGYQVEYARPYVHKWPPYYRTIARLGWPLFNLACRIYARLDRRWFQVEVRARKLTP